ncbi:molybdate transport repressor ModE-like protein [Lysobacter enzymogenes]|uniref:LysR family transcriptional regulator n=1 Tax=Lysobacter enzymogenes TaxID=69 RepID=UPI00339B7BA0
MRQTARLSLEDFELLRAIGAHGSLSGAAKALALDHSSAFRRLGAIEARAGTPLFRRSRTGYTATEAGAVAIEGAQRILDDADQLQRQLAGRDARGGARLRITIPDTLAEVAARLCAAFTAAHPQIGCDLSVSNAFVNLQQPEADVALRACALMPNGLSVRRVGSIATAVYAASGAKVGKREALNEGVWVGFDDNLSHLSSAMWLRANVDEARIAMRVNSLPAALAACKAGVGRALLPCYFADAAGGVKRVSQPLAEVPTELWFAIHPDLRRSARVRALREFALAWLPKEMALT